jgi:hypothetical protein
MCREAALPSRDDYCVGCGTAPCKHREQFPGWSFVLTLLVIVVLVVLLAR